MILDISHLESSFGHQSVMCVCIRIVDPNAAIATSGNYELEEICCLYIDVNESCNLNKHIRSGFQYDLLLANYAFQFDNFAFLIFITLLPLPPPPPPQL